MIKPILENTNRFDFMPTVLDSSIDLVLADPPYNISRDTGFKNVKHGVERFAVDMNFGEWDQAPIDLVQVCGEYHRVLKKGGSVIVFYDLWKVTELKLAMEKAGFKQIRMIVWNKTNPVPLNSSRNYLTNSREIAVLGVKHSKPTFNSRYDPGNYYHPITGGDRFHPTQKPVKLIIELINKHSNPGEWVLDDFAGSGTTAIGCIRTGRKFVGCELDQGYWADAVKRIQKEWNEL
tara:strand:- start:1113 stop:1814 length:702 start_codon:yes stop_codon:yes gene_type:complete